VTLLDVELACGWLLGALLVWAAVAKIRRPDFTRESFARLGLRWPDSLAVAVPAVELVVAVLLVAWPPAGGAAALVLFVAFTVVLVRVVRSGAHVGCACFGSPRVESVSWADVVRNVGLVVMSVLAMSAPAAGWPGIAALAVTAAFVVAGAFVVQGLRPLVAR
jgi:hypothetical protein